MGVILSAQAAGLAQQLRDDGPKAVELLQAIATHFAQVRTRVEALLALPESDATDKAKVATALTDLLTNYDALRSEVAAFIETLEA